MWYVFNLYGLVFWEFIPYEMHREIIFVIVAGPFSHEEDAKSAAKSTSEHAIKSA